MRNRPWIIALGLFALTLVAYVPALQCGFIWDDDDYVTENPVLRTAHGLVQIWIEPTSLPQYYPLVHTTFWIEYQLWGLAPLGYHLVNVLLHACNAVLLWRVLATLGVPGALFAACLFAVHPVHVESVAWVTERKNVLSLAFYLLAALAWLRWRGDFVDEPRGSARGYVLVVVLFVAALLGKTVAASLPAAMLLVVWWKTGRLGWRDVRMTLPLFAIGVTLGVVTVWLERTHVRAEGSAWDLSSLERLLIMGRAPWFYASKLVWPAELVFIYPRWDLDAGSVVQWLFPAASVALIAALWAGRRRLGRGPLVAVLFFGGTLIPALGLFDVYPFRYSFVADHFQYHASIGLIALISAAGVAACTRLGPRARLAVASVPIASCATLTWSHCGTFENLERLWRDTMEVNPRATIAHVNLGKILLDRNETAAATRHLETALELEEDFYEAHVNLSAIRFGQGDLAEAERHLVRASDLRPDHPTGWHNLAKVRQRQGRTREALELVEKAIAADSDFFASRQLATELLMARGSHGAAIPHIDMALRLNPGDYTMRVHAIDCLLATEQYDLAVGNALVAMRMDPRLSSIRTKLTQGLDGLVREGRRAEAAQGAATAAELLQAGGQAQPAERFRAMAAEFAR